MVKKSKPMSRDHDEPLETTTLWKAVSRCLAWAVTLVVVCIALALFKPQLNRRAQLDARIEALKAERAQARLTYESIKSKLEWLKNDREYLEVHVRDRLDVAREGEWVFQFSDAKDTAR